MMIDPTTSKIRVTEQGPSRPPNGLSVPECREMGFKSLFFFTKEILGYDKFVKRVHGPICRKLQDIDIPRLNVTMPRKHFKSTLCSESYPLWRSIGNPNITMLLAMNTMDNGKQKLREIQAHVERNQLFRACYPEVIPMDFNKGWAAESCSMRRTAITGVPTFNVAGANTNVVSRSLDEIIMDDLLTAKQGEGEGNAIFPTNDMIAQSIRWYRGSMSLLKDPMNGRMLNIGTRWAQNDLVDHILKTNYRFRDNNFEIRAITGEWGQPDCKPIMPEVYPMEVLEELYETQGPTIFHMWYLNEPIDPSELVFHLDNDENFYNPSLATTAFINSLRKYTAVDLAYSDGAKNDNNAIVTIGVDHRNYRYVLDVQYGKWSPATTIEMLFSIYARLQPEIIGVESVAGQELLIKLLPYFMKKKGVALPIKKIKRGGGMKKEYRIMLGIQPWVQNRMLKLPEGSQSKPIITEMTDFRISKKRRGHDDALDALADAIQLSQAARVEIVKKREQPDYEGARKLIYSTDAAIDELIGNSGRTQLPFENQLRDQHYSYLEN